VHEDTDRKKGQMSDAVRPKTARNGKSVSVTQLVNTTQKGGKKKRKELNQPSLDIKSRREKHKQKKKRDRKK